MTDRNSQIVQLQIAALQLAEGFDRASKMPEKDQAEALREATPALIEMRRTCDALILRMRGSSVPPQPTLDAQNAGRYRFKS